MRKKNFTFVYSENSWKIANFIIPNFQVNFVKPFSRSPFYGTHLERQKKSLVTGIGLVVLVFFGVIIFVADLRASDLSTLKHFVMCDFVYGNFRIEVDIHY